MAESRVDTPPKPHIEAASFMAAVEAQCHERVLRLTPVRKKVLSFIAEAGKPVKAYELLQIVRPGDPSSAAGPPTVYRVLDFLLTNGFIHRLKSVNAFVPCYRHQTTPRSLPFLICDQCHQAVELENQELVAVLEKSALTLGFVPHMQTLEVHGVCAHCQAGPAQTGRP